MKWLCFVSLILFTAALCSAQETTPSLSDRLSAPSAGAASPAESLTYPKPAAHPHWARSVVTGVFALFVLAIPVGVLVRLKQPRKQAPDALPDEAAHGEHGAADAHH